MDRLRSLIGLGDPPAAAAGQQQQPLRNADDSRARLIRKFELQIEALHEEDFELEERAAAEAAAGKRAAVARTLQRRKAISVEISDCEGKLANQRSIGSTLGQADSNHEQALLMQDASTKLGALNKNAERIDLNEVVDKYRDAAADTRDYSKRLAEPLYPIGEDVEDPEELDAEVEALMQRAADETRLAMPAAPAAAAASRAAVVSQRRTPAAVSKGDD